MQAFDFDNTIYKGESAFDFALFVMRKKISLIRYLPHILSLLYKYEKCKMSSKEFQEAFNSYASVLLKNKEIVYLQVECNNFGSMKFHEKLGFKKADDIIIWYE